MAAFFGTERKLTVSIMAVYMIGWLFFLIGFILLATENGLSEGAILMPWIVFAVGGPALFVMNLCYAGTTGLTSSLLGFVTAYLSVFVCASMSYSMYLAYLASKETASVVLVIIGAVICIHCWCVALITSTLYKDHDANTVTEHPHNRLFQGYARKVIILPSILMLIGWIFILVGASGASYQQLPIYVGVALSGFVAIALILAHAGTWGAVSRALGVITPYAITVYVFFAGVWLYGSGLFILATTPTNDHVTPLIFVGSLLSSLSMAVVLSLWPFYHRSGSWTLKTLETTPTAPPRGLFHETSTVPLHSAQADPMIPTTDPADNDEELLDVIQEPSPLQEEKALLSN